LDFEDTHFLSCAEVWIPASMDVPQVLLSGGVPAGDRDYAVAQLRQRLLGVLAKADGPGKAMDWVETLPHRGVADHFRQEAMARWLAEDTEAASAWVAALPPGPARDFHALSIIQQACEEDPVAAARGAESLSDPKLRAEASERIGAH
jgi:hypothetical protein